MGDLSKGDGAGNAPGPFALKVTIQIVEDAVAGEVRLAALRGNLAHKCGFIIVDGLGEAIIDVGKDRREKVDGASDGIDFLERHVDRTAVVVSDQRKFRGDLVFGDVVGQIRRLSADPALGDVKARLVEADHFAIRAFKDVYDIEIGHLVGRQLDVQRRAALFQNGSRPAVENCGGIEADAVDRNARYPAHNGTQEKAIEGGSLFGEVPVHLGSGRQHKKCEAMRRGIAVDSRQFLRTVIFSTDIDRKGRGAGDEDTVFRLQATLAGHEIGDGAADPVAPGKLAESAAAPGEKK